jgi:hypothetical protein
MSDSEGEEEKAASEAEEEVRKPRIKYILQTHNTKCRVGLKGRGWTGVLLVVKELGFLNVRSVVALPMAQTVRWDEDQHTLPKSNQM